MLNNKRCIFDDNTYTHASLTTWQQFLCFMYLCQRVYIVHLNIYFFGEIFMVKGVLLCGEAILLLCKVRENEEKAFQEIFFKKYP